MPQVYSKTARALHWLTALLLVINIPLALAMTRMADGQPKYDAYTIHESIGLTILTATTARLIWRLINPPPPLVQPALIRLAAHVTHGAMYVLLFAIPITGWMTTSAFGFPPTFFDLFTLPNLVAENRPLANRLQVIHPTLAMALVALFFAHVGGALFHHFIKRDDTLRRMIPRLSRR